MLFACMQQLGSHECSTNFRQCCTDFLARCLVNICPSSHIIMIGKYRFAPYGHTTSDHLAGETPTYCNSKCAAHNSTHHDGWLKACCNQADWKQGGWLIILPLMEQDNKAMAAACLQLAGLTSKTDCKPSYAGYICIFRSCKIRLH